MFDLETAVVDWRDRMERRSSLSAREVDELEDHLRARIELELELDAGLVPAQAFAVARDDIGEATTLSREFAKAGTPRWRKLLVAGWAMFTASWFLPVHGFNLFGRESWDSGYEVVWGILTETPVPLLLPNLAMLLTVLAFRDPRPRGRWLERMLWVAGLTALGLGLLASRTMLVSGGSGLMEFGIGYWVWSASLTSAAAALRLRAREWASARLASDQLSLSARMLTRSWGNYSGHDAAYGNPMMVPTVNEDIRGGTHVDLPLWLNFYFPDGALNGHRIAAEWHIPLYQNLHRPQLATDWLLTIGWQKSFAPIGHD